MPKKPPTKPHGAPFETEDAAAAYAHFLPKAQAIPDERVVICRADPALARLNVQRGVDALRPHLDRIRSDLPRVSVEAILELPALALALMFASDRVPAPAASPGEIDEHLAKLRPLRGLLLDQLDIFAALGLVPAEAVAAIRRGSGPLDAARDGIALAALFHDNAAVFAGKHPFTEEQLTELAEHGNWLVQHLTPTGARPAPTPRSEAAVLRDRFWTALQDGYQELRKAGLYLFGEGGVDAEVPALQARVAPPKAGSAAPSGAPDASPPGRAPRDASPLHPSSSPSAR